MAFSPRDEVGLVVVFGVEECVNYKVHLSCVHSLHIRTFRRPQKDIAAGTKNSSSGKPRHSLGEVAKQLQDVVDVRQAVAVNIAGGALAECAQHNQEIGDRDRAVLVDVGGLRAAIVILLG